MQELLNFLSNPWPWYVSGPLIGLMIPTLLLVIKKNFGLYKTTYLDINHVTYGDLQI